MSVHICLLGDSVFDNAAYVGRGDEVIRTLRDRLPPGARATLLARDGAVLTDVRRQIASAPADVTHLMISAGGNDALGQLGVLGLRVATVGEAVATLAAVRRRFEDRYRAMLDHVLSFALPTAICTIYDARFPDPDLRETANTALAVLNDVITREAGRRGLPLLDLRVLFHDDADFANAIEPSAQGGEKIACAVIEIVDTHDFATGRCSIYPRPQNYPQTR